MFNPIEILKTLHVTERFDCGKEPLNVFLKKYALQNQSSLSARTFVITIRDGRVAGYYSLAASSVEYGEAPMRVVKGLAKHPVPVILLARLAVDKEFQGEGLGTALLKDAVLRCLRITEELAVRAILVHAKDDEARIWYKKYEFEEGPTEPYHLFLLMKDVKAIFGSDP
jgi:GNAT superfamily N-acetyltransferase